MKEHIRVDALKVFKEDDSILQQIMADTKTKNKSEGYRTALKSYSENRNKDLAYKQLEQKVDEQAKEIAQLKEAIDDLNFFLRAKLG